MNQKNWKKIFTEEDNNYMLDNEKEIAREIFNTKGFKASVNYIIEIMGDNGFFSEGLEWINVVKKE